MVQRSAGWWRAALRAGVLASLLAGPAPAAEPLRGPARALDGDTLELGHLRIRLHGVDAPELDQTCADAAGVDWPCGAVSRDRLAALIDGVEVGCRPRERDAYGRLVARCSVAGEDLGGRLVAEGLAWAYLRFSFAYADAERAAQAAGLGVWQGTAVAAWDYRAGDWTPAAGGAAPAAGDQPAATTPLALNRAVEAPAPEGCAIKGNITAKGERVYHTPGSRWYERTIIETSGGEAWFCTAEEAEAAGWRAAVGSR